MFDARAAKLLAPGAHLTIAEAPGLRLEATNTTRTWVYRYKSPVDSRMRQVKLGSWPAMPYQAAWVEWEKLRQVRESGGDPSIQKKAAKDAELAKVKAVQVANRLKRYTVQRACDDHVEALKRTRQEKGWKEVQRMYATMLRDLPARAAASIDRRDAYGLIESWAHIPVQAGKLRAEMGAAWDRALDAGDLPENTPNWWRQIMRGKLKSKGREIDGGRVSKAARVLSMSHELGEVIRWLPNFPRTTEDALTLYFWTGCRGSEIVSIHASEISEEADGWWWTVPKAKTKNARIEEASDLRVPLIGRALAAVKRRMTAHPGGYLFPSYTAMGHIEQKAIGLSVWSHQPYSKTKPEYQRARLTVTKWSPHDIRRTVRTTLASLGCPEGVAEAVLGHIQTGVKGIYNLHRYDAERRHWLGLLDAKLEELAAG